MERMDTVMTDNKITFSVFTKPWKNESINELGKLIGGFGFDGIEFPLRDGYQLEPKDAENGLPKLVKQLDEYGLKITSVASDTSEKVFAGCANAGIPVIRIMAGVNLKIGYLASIEQKKRELDTLIPLCEKYGVKVGIQQHYGPMVSNSMELKQLIEQYNPKYIAAVWDAAHSALAGEETEQGLDILWSHLCMVNLKNAFYKLASGPEAENAKWERYFTLGRKGLSSWNRVFDYLKNKNYSGVICLTAEYSDEEHVNQYTASDLTYAKSLLCD